MFRKHAEAHDGEFNWLKRAEELSSDVRTLDQRVSALQQSVNDTNSRFGGRIGAMEARNEVQDAQMKSIKEAVTELKGEIRASQTEQKDSIAALRAEQKEAMAEVKAEIHASQEEQKDSMAALRVESQQSMSKLEQNYKEILDAVTPMKHEISDVEELKKEVAELKAKPAKTWEGIKEKSIGWLLILGLTIVAAALGLSKFL